MKFKPSIFSTIKSHSYKFSGDHEDSIARDVLARKMTQIVALDAIPYYDDPSSQFLATNVNRDLEKAYVAFESTTPRVPIATGNWGCGAFGGNVQLKFLIQLMAAAVAKKPLIFFTFDNLMSSQNETLLSEELQELFKLVENQNVCKYLTSKILFNPHAIGRDC